MTVKIEIRRARGNVESFEVPYREGMSILDGLKEIGHSTPDLAYRWECGQGICGVCTMMVNGKPALSCSKLVVDGETYSLAPLRGYPVEKDLLVDFTARLQEMQRIQPYLVDGGKPIESKAEADQSKLVRSCIECGACVAVCPVSINTDHADALSMVKLARFALDPRDNADRRQLAEDGGLDLYARTCSACRMCSNICPKGIDVYTDAVLVLKAVAPHPTPESADAQK